MNIMMRMVLWNSLTLGVLGLPTAVVAQEAALSFFITGTGKGADLGGLAGADRHCQTLAQAVGAGGRMWRAYLSIQAVDGTPGISARDRIGRGPWYNTKGEIIAKDVEELHGANHLHKQSGLTEWKGEKRCQE